jgi:hypothetical protein
MAEQAADDAKAKASSDTLAAASFELCHLIAELSQLLDFKRIEYSVAP